MDLSHETDFHQGSIGQLEINEKPTETRVVGDDVIVQRWMPGIERPLFWREALQYTGPVDRWQICHFMPPSSVIFDVGVAPIAANATLDDHDMGARGLVIDALTPEAEIGSRYFWGLARNFDVDDQGFTARMTGQQSGVFQEGVILLEAQQRSTVDNRDMKLIADSIDQGGVRARRFIERLRSVSEAAVVT